MDYQVAQFELVFDVTIQWPDWILSSRRSGGLFFLKQFLSENRFAIRNIFTHGENNFGPLGQHNLLV